MRISGFFVAGENLLLLGAAGSASLRRGRQIDLTLQHLNQLIEVFEGLLFLAPAINEKQPVVVDLDRCRDDVPGAGAVQQIGLGSRGAFDQEMPGLRQFRPVERHERRRNRHPCGTHVNLEIAA